MLDQKKSDSTALTGRPDLPIKIVHKDPELRVTLSSESDDGKIVEHDYVYVTDGRGEANPARTAFTTNPSQMNANDLKKQVTKSKTKWTANGIIIRSFLPLTIGGRVVEFEQVDEWKLSGNGNTLIQTTRTIPVTGTEVFMMATEKKRVYNRV